MLFALATASAGAAPCFAMSASAPALQHSHESTSVGTHDHAITDEQAASHLDAATHDHAASHEPAGAAGGEALQHAACPHCPLGAAANTGSASHALCAASDDASAADGAKPVGSPPALKHVFATAQLQLLPEYRPPRARSALEAGADAASSSVALNLRHCVLLI
jgi:hypothetical protein